MAENMVYGDLEDTQAIATSDHLGDTSLLDELVEVGQKALAHTVKIDVNPQVRPGGWVLEFDAVIGAREVTGWTKAGGKVGSPNYDNVRATALPLVFKNIGIYKGAQQVFDSEGDPLTLRSIDWLTKVGKQTEKTFDAVKAVSQFLGDAQVIVMGTSLLKAAGYADEVEAVDPTQG